MKVSCKHVTDAQSTLQDPLKTSPDVPLDQQKKIQVKSFTHKQREALRPHPVSIASSSKLQTVSNHWSTCCIYTVATETPMLEGEEEEGLHLWHLVKSSEDPDIPKHRKSSMRDRERAKAIPEIYLTRLLSMKVTCWALLQQALLAGSMRWRWPCTCPSSSRGRCRSL